MKGLYAATPFEFVVLAISDVGLGVRSKPAAIEQTQDPDAPEVPTNVRAVAVGPDSVRLTWEAPYDNGSEIALYRIDRCDEIPGTARESVSSILFMDEESKIPSVSARSRAESATSRPGDSAPGTSRSGGVSALNSARSSARSQYGAFTPFGSWREDVAGNLTDVLIPDMDPGVAYKFRVAAVNIEGQVSVPSLTWGSLPNPQRFFPSPLHRASGAHHASRYDFQLLSNGTPRKKLDVDGDEQFCCFVSLPSGGVFHSICTNYSYLFFLLLSARTIFQDPDHAHGTSPPFCDKMSDTISPYRPRASAKIRTSRFTT